MKLRRANGTDTSTFTAVFQNIPHFWGILKSPSDDTEVFLDWYNWSKVFLKTWTNIKERSRIRLSKLHTSTVLWNSENFPKIVENFKNVYGIWKTIVPWLGRSADNLLSQWRKRIKRIRISIRDNFPIPNYINWHTSYKNRFSSAIWKSFCIRRLLK